MAKVVDDVTARGRLCMVLRPAVSATLWGLGILLGYLIGQWM
jgi:hypothetical protein